MIVRERFLVDAISVNKIEGLPFRVAEMRRAIDRAVEGNPPVIPFPEHRL